MIAMSEPPFLNCLLNKAYLTAIIIGSEYNFWQTQEIISLAYIIAPNPTLGSPTVLNYPSFDTYTYLLNRLFFGTRTLCMSI